MKNFSIALRSWEKILLNKNQISVDYEELENASKATFKTMKKIKAILKPRNTNEVSLVLKIASKYKIPLYVVSAGKNWGLGSKVPMVDSVLLDLSTLNKIRKYNESLAYLTVEAGVSFRQAVQYLSKINSPLMLDTLGSTPDASIVGNTVERGHGMALYADRFNFVCGMEVVLPTGEIIHTGYEAFENTAIGHLAKWGVGPYIDGLFTQSSLGVVTALTIWLKPKTKFFQSFIFHLSSDAALPPVIEKLQSISLQGFPVSLRIFNEMRMISFARRFPENTSKPLSEKETLSICKEMNIGRWIGIGGLYAVSKAHAEADKIFLTELLQDHVQSIQFYNEEYVTKEYAKATIVEKQTMDFMFNHSLLNGNISEAGLNMVYWRKPSSITIGDLHQDGCGVQWYCPAIPFTGKAVKETVSICRRLSKQYGFELNLGFLFINARTLDITGAICYDRESPGDDEKAMQCQREIMKILQSKGYNPYRLGIQSMDLLKNIKPENKKFLIRLKQTIDPSLIMNTSKYIL